MSSVAKGSQQEPGTRTPTTHGMDGGGEFLTCAIPGHWMALEICFCYRPDSDLSWVPPKTTRKTELLSKGVLQANHFSTASMDSTTRNEEPLLTSPMLSTAKARGKVSIPARVHFSEPKLLVQEGFLTNVDGSSKDISIFKKSISWGWRDG